MQPALTLSPDNSVYLELGLDAVKYVKGKVQAGSANRQEDADIRQTHQYQQLDKEYLIKQRNAIRMTANNSLDSTVVSGRMRAPQIIDFEDKVCFQAGLIES